MAFFRKNEAVICLFAGLALSLALGIGLSIPAWGLYVQIKDLGPGGVGSEAQAETPVAGSIAEMETLERFVVHAVQTAWDDQEGFHLLDAYYKVVTLDSGERIAMRYNIEADQYKPGEVFWCSPIGAWRPWELTEQERAVLAREDPGLTTTDYYADMLGNHESALTQGKFLIFFSAAAAVVVFAALMALRALWKRHKKNQEEITRPKNDLELWLVGTYAIWGQFYASLFPGGAEAPQKGAFHIGAVPRTPETVKDMKETLDDSWDITSYEDLLDTVEYMSAGPGFQNCVDQAGRAWELCRSMQLLGCAYLVEWCGREEMLRRSCEVGKIIQDTFQSWDELCQGFLDGFAAWRLSGGLAPEAAREYVQQRAGIYWAIKGRKDSPYNLPWRMELDPKKK